MMKFLNIHKISNINLSDIGDTFIYSDLKQRRMFYPFRYQCEIFNIKEQQL